MESRQISCNACGADEFAPQSTVDGWVIGQCRSCGLVFVNPAPFFGATDEFSEMSRAFEYTEYMHRPISPGILAFERQQLEANLADMSRWSRSGPGAQGRLRFLDIGCGSGAAVRAATDLGWEAIGIDIDPQLVRTGREQLNVDLRAVPILESGLPAGQFDFIKLRDVVEHLPNPREVLDHVRTLLAPGGVAPPRHPQRGRPGDPHAGAAAAPAHRGRDRPATPPPALLHARHPAADAAPGRAAPAGDVLDVAVRRALRHLAATWSARRRTRTCGPCGASATRSAWAPCSCAGRRTRRPMRWPDPRGEAGSAGGQACPRRHRCRGAPG